MNRLIIVAIVAIGVIYLGFSSIYVVGPTDQAIVTRFGQITRVVKEPGLYFKLPTNVVDKVQFVDKRLLRFDLNNITLQVKDGRFYNVDAFLTYRINNPRLFRERLSGSLDLADQRLNTRFESALRQVYGLRGFDEALSKQRPVMMEEAQKLIKAETDQLGLDVVDVRILRTDLTNQVSAQTYDRMKAERLAEAAQLRALGKQQAQTIRAVADRQAVEIVADANRDSNILRGEGDAERAAIFAKSYERDPNFFAFYRSLQAYKGSLSGKNTTMVVSPTSQFFEFFGNDGEATAPKPNPANAAPPPPALTETPETTAPVELDITGDNKAGNTIGVPAPSTDQGLVPSGTGTTPPAGGTTGSAPSGGTTSDSGTSATTPDATAPSAP